MRKLTIDEFIQKSNKIHNNFYNYNKVNYVNTTQKVIITCPIHGDFEQSPNHHMGGQGCLKCYRDKQKLIYLSNTQKFISKATLVHKDKYDYSKVNYVKAKIPVIIICRKHGEFLQTPDNHLQGKGCPHCKSKQQADLYKKLLEQFPKETILYEVGNRVIPWLERQRFDIYFPRLNIAVEYNGPQHYMPIKRLGGNISYEKTLIRDQDKREKCKNNDCILYELKYDYTEDDFNRLCEAIRDRTGLIKECKKGGTLDGNK